MRPEKEHLDDDEAAGVNHPSRSENGHHQRDDEIAGIGVNRGGVFERIELEQDFEKPAQRDQQDVEHDRQGDREFQPVNDVGRVLDLEGVNHHRRADEVERDDGERAAVFGIQKLGFHQRHAHQDNQGQLGDFAGEEQSGFHECGTFGENGNFTLARQCGQCIRNTVSDDLSVFAAVFKRQRSSENAARIFRRPHALPCSHLKLIHYTHRHSGNGNALPQVEC